MKLGLGVWTMQVTDDAPLDHAAPYGDFLEAAVLADRLGFHSIWVSEHHFVDDGYCPSLLVALASAVALTSRVRLGTGALILPLRDPEVVAAQASHLAQLSRGRLELGVGVGYRAEEFAALGVDRRTRVTRFESMLAELLDAVACPLWVTAATPAGARRAAEHRSSLLLSPAVDDGRALELAASYRRAGGGGSVGLMRDVWTFGEGTAPPPALVAEHLHRLYVRQYASWGFLQDRAGAIRPGDRGRLRTALAGAARTAWIAPPSGVAERCRRLEEGGVDLVILRVQWGWHERPHVLEQIERLSALFREGGS